jgi:hypothetical protein
MKLPNADQAIIDRRKLGDYCLSPTHRYGRHKAKLFAKALGLSMADIDLLQSALLTAAKEGDAVKSRHNGFGQLYELKFDMAGTHGMATVHSVWIVLENEQIPRLVTCYLL